MSIPFQPSIVYGPIHSRRLGISLGINILPVDDKACNFNCVYCQYGSTRGGWDAIERRAHWPSYDEVMTAVEAAMLSAVGAPDHLTIAGNGEPTGHPEFPEIVDGLLRLRDREMPATKTAILTNASFLDHPTIRAAVRRIDVKMLKLDCGDEQTFRRYNRSTTRESYEALVHQMKGLDNVIVQSLFTGGAHGNSDPAAVRAWVDRVGELSPALVHVYSLDRTCDDPTLLKLSRQELVAIQRQLTERGIRSEVF